MDKENGDEYIRRTATFVRTHEQRLADAAIISRRRPQRPPTGSTSVLGWIGLGATEQPKKPLIFTDDPHHLFYLLMRFEGLGIDVGPLDVRVQNPTRPTSMSYLAMLAIKDKSDVLSISSFRSTMSSVSMFSLGGGWFGRAEPASLDAELKYLYSAFTKLPALRIRPSGVKVISELAEDPPTDSGIPMDAFKNLQTLECHDIDPRTLIGWDRLSEGLRSLTVKRTGLEDVSDLFVDSVIDDRLRREGNPKRVARPRLVHHSRQSSFQPPPSVPEDWEPESTHVVSQDTPLERLLSPYAWSLLTHLSLSDNNLTFLPSLPALPNLSSLDLSSNLLISIPTSLATLPSLKSLNLSHNMVDSVLGIYSQIPSIISLNISSNRLDSLCGLERLKHLSRIDLRDNKVEDTDEIGRLAVLSGVKEVWVTGNPCTQRYQDWRVRCFDLFAKEGRVVLLDGSMPGLMESRAMEYYVNKTSHTHSHGDNGRPLSDCHSPSNINVNGDSTPPPASPHTAALQQSPRPSPALSAVHSVASTPELQSKARRRKNKRIVDLDDKESVDDLRRETNGFVKSHGRHSSDVGVLRHHAIIPPGQSFTNISVAPPHDSIGYVSSNVAASPAPLDPTSSVTPDGLPSLRQSSISELPATASRTRQDAGTSRTIASAKSNKRRVRLSPSMYEPASASHGFPDRTLEVEGSSRSSSGKPSVSEAEKFRKQIEALRSEVGDSWLKVLSQTHLGSPDEAVTRR
ncbi:hypothetical protein JB92DRAFT_3101083 [Gautieria morchelliformis]|nr:hypothetical protein JB92DRAFT_3101083 [Gautieria morchelliformis]